MLFDWSGGHQLWLERVVLGFGPAVGDLVYTAFEGKRVDLARRAQNTDGDRDIRALDVVEDQPGPVPLRDPLKDAACHGRDLPVAFHLRLDAEEFSRTIECGEVVP